LISQHKTAALEFSMKLYVTFTSPYARLARILVLEKALEDRVEIIAAKTRATDSPYYQINPSGRVPYLIDDSGVGMEDSQLICAYLDSLDGKPRFHDPRRQTDWAYQRLEFAARNMCEGICVWIREMARPAGERSPTALAHEVARAQRMADVFEGRIADPLMQGAPNMAQLILAVALDVARTQVRGSYYRPPAARHLDTLHVRALFDAKYGTTVMEMSALRGKADVG
jgi:glutathione S-transferase